MIDIQTNTERLRSNIKTNKQTEIDYYFIRGYGGLILTAKESFFPKSLQSAICSRKSAYISYPSDLPNLDKNKRM